MRIGAPAQAILEEASARRADLIVMGTRGRGGLSALGSVAMRIAHGSHLPTILVKHDTRLPAELGLRVRALVPPQRIAQLAAEMRSDLVVMGTRGLGAAHHALLGSVALVP